MELSKSNKIMIEISQRGYKVDERGDVYFKGKKRSLVFDKMGYCNFTVRVNSDGKSVCRRIWVHRLQAYQKFGNEMFKDNIQVRHFNGISTDNSYVNILIGTVSENHFDKSPEIRKRMAIMASSKNRRFSDEEIREINEDKKGGMSYNQLIKKYKTSKSTLSYIFNKAIYNGNSSLTY